MRSMMTRLLCVALGISVYHSCLAMRYEKTGHISEVVTKFLVENTPVSPDEKLEVKVNSANAEINVPACASGITAGFPPDANREQPGSVELSCNDDKTWHVLVPVDVQVYAKVLVSKRTIAAKEMISPEDVDYEYYNKNRLYNGYFTKTEDIAGIQSAGLLIAGTVLTKKNTQLPVLISRNQVVAIIAQSGSIMVTMQGIARSDGSMNSVIKVYNPSSKRTLDAIVIGPNKALVLS